MNDTAEHVRHDALTAQTFAAAVQLPNAALQDAWYQLILRLQVAKSDNALEFAMAYALGWSDALLTALVIDEATADALKACSESAYAQHKERPTATGQ